MNSTPPQNRRGASSNPWFVPRVKPHSAGTGADVGPLGAWVDPNGGVRVRTWAPGHEKLELVEHDPAGEPLRTHPMQPEPDGYFSVHVHDGAPGLLYKIRIDGAGPFPDPWSRSQPLGVHGPSEVVTSEFDWTDHAWRGLSMDALVIYEVHVGTATPEGTFKGLIKKLGMLKELGVNALELMPVASFPGARNWGYDGVSLNAPQATYGGPDGLRKLIDAAHAHGLAVLIDAVYNHFGPDGNYLRCYSPHYFTGRHHTPWGEAVNYDGEKSAPVRELVLRNVEMWIRDFHADGLRLDATHAIIDDSPTPLLQEIQARARAAAGGRRVVLIAEDERNEPRVVLPVERGGWGLDGVWADDLHHQLRRAFAGDSDGYYADYTGSAADIAKTLNQGWFYEGQPSKVHGKPRGKPAQDAAPWQLVHCIQNHDQIGNRAVGDRLSESVSPAAFRAMSTLLLLSPYTPLLFMGQEWNAKTPFQYFTHHHPELGRLVTEGRRKEFEHFANFKAEQVPDPQALETFERSRLDWVERERSGNAQVLALYRELLRLRAEDPLLRQRERGSFEAQALGDNAVALERRAGSNKLLIVVAIRGTVRAPMPPGAKLLLWSEHPRFGGGSEQSPLGGGALVLEGPGAAVVEL